MNIHLAAINRKLVPTQYLYQTLLDNIPAFS